jgi:Mg2+ and Co2+ transporter CorA
MGPSNVDIAFLAQQSANILGEIKSTRKDVADIRSLALQTYDFSRRVEKRQAELRDDLEVAMKIEFGGSFAHLQTSIESMFGQLSDRIDALGDQLSVLEQVTSI